MMNKSLLLQQQCSLTGCLLLISPFFCFIYSKSQFQQVMHWVFFVTKLMFKYAGVKRTSLFCCVFIIKVVFFLNLKHPLEGNFWSFSNYYCTSDALSQVQPRNFLLMFICVIAVHHITDPIYQALETLKS